MSTNAKPWLLTARVLLFLSLCLLRAPADDKSNSTGLETLLAQRLPAGGPGVVILVARDGKLLFCHGYGLADREEQIPATPTTQFRIGSLTKQFTAAAILRLRQDGKLSVDDPLAKYFPTYPDGEKITLRQLLHHTSGLHNFTSHPDFSARVVRPIAPADLVAWFQDDPPDFPPGEQFEYCNTGYVLLGQIVEKVSGQSLGDYFQQQFFTPLKMNGTGVFHNASPPDHAAKGYSSIAGQLQPALDWDMSWAGGAGELYSTVGDLWRWTEALQGGRVLSPEDLRDMLAEFTIPRMDTLTQRYGMGIGHVEIEWLPFIGHDGGLPGFLSELMWFPEEKVTIAVLSNAMPPPPGTAPSALVPVAVRAFLPAEIAAHAPKIDPAIDPKTYPDYVGRYDYKGSGIQEITTANGHLYAQLTGQDKFEVYPSAPDTFFFKIAAASMAFQRDKTGAVTAVIHHQGGSTFTAPKISEQDSPVLSNEALDTIVGQYQYGPATVLTVIRKGDQLYAQLTGQPEAPIFPKSDHEFFWKIVPASVEFIRGPDGKIVRAIHHQNGTTLTAPRLTSK